jgi:hypothetical protein
MRRDDRGSALVEFALLSLLLALLLAAAIDFGRLMFCAQALQDAARAAARELALMPLPADVSFEAALAYVDPGTGLPVVRDRVFNPGCLVVDLEPFDDDEEIDAFLAQMPVVNRALRPLMIVDWTSDHKLLRYPGALLEVGMASPPPSCAGAPPTTFVVGIPQIVTHDPVETIRWLPVIEEIRSDPADPATGPFSLTGAATPRGLVAIRINYPYQAGAMSSFQPNPPGPLEFQANITNPNYADEDAVLETNPEARPGDTIEDDPDTPGPFGAYTGPFGLGRQIAFASTVRPYSKVLAGQAIFRREVVLP